MNARPNLQIVYKAIAFVMFGAISMALGLPYTFVEDRSQTTARLGTLSFIVGALVLGAGLMLPYRRPVAGAVLGFFATAVFLSCHDGDHLLLPSLIWVAVFAVYASIVIMLCGPGKSSANP